MTRAVHPRLLIIILLIAVLLPTLLAGGLAAPAPTPASASTPTTPATFKKMVILADRVVSEKQEAKVRITTFSKATITQEDSTFQANLIVMRSQNDAHEFTCTGSPVFTDAENHITSGMVKGFSSPRRAIFSDNVVMVSTPRKNEKNTGDMKSKMTEPSTLNCDNLDYDYAGKRALAKGNVVVKQKTRTIWADQGIYEQNVELVTLKGNIKMKSNGEKVDDSVNLEQVSGADTVTVSLRDDWIDMAPPEGQQVKIDILVKDDTNKPAGTDTKPPAPSRPPAEPARKPEEGNK